jgi:hypothetical protein
MLWHSINKPIETFAQTWARAAYYGITRKPARGFRKG